MWFDRKNVFVRLCVCVWKRILAMDDYYLLMFSRVLFHRLDHKSMRFFFIFFTPILAISKLGSLNVAVTVTVVGNQNGLRH